MKAGKMGKRESNGKGKFFRNGRNCLGLTVLLLTAFISGSKAQGGFAADTLSRQMPGQALTFGVEESVRPSVAVRRFASVGIANVPLAVREEARRLYPDCTWINAGKNEQEEYALIIMTGDSVRKTLVIKQNGELLSDK